MDQPASVDFNLRIISQLNQKSIRKSEVPAFQTDFLERRRRRNPMPGSDARGKPKTFIFTFRCKVVLHEKVSYTDKFSIRAGGF